jgi:hypothetical protein
VSEGFVLRVDDDLRHDRGHRNVAPPLFRKEVRQGLLDHVADEPLALGAADVERHRRRHVLADLVLQEDVPHLRPVAVRDDDLVLARLDHVRQLLARYMDVLHLLLERPALAGLQNRVPAQSYDDELLLDCHPITFPGSDLGLLRRRLR